MFLLSLIAGLASAQAGAVEITVYNQGFALVKENRTLQLRQGRQSVAIENVAAAIEPQSVGVRSLTDPTSFEVLEQNYQYDLISPTAILAKAVGQKIKFLRVLPNGNRETLEGKLVSSPTAIVNTGGGGQQTYNGMVIQTDDGRVILNPTGEIEVAAIPEGLISKPTLLWDLDVAKAGPNEVELSYITQQMSWTASYVLTLDGVGSGDIRGWVSMNNNSGATYKDAKLKLLAGDVQRAQPRVQEFGRRGGAGGAVADKGFAEEAFFEYHLYTLQRPATLRNNEMKQLSLLEASGLKVEKKLILDSMQDFGRYLPGEGEVGTGNIKPMVRVEFVNSKANQMGMPLPQGTVKVFQRDKSGSVQLLGEDQIQHTPRDERVSLFVGRSFDIVGTRKRTNWRWADNSRRNIEETFEIEVRNRKETPETLIVLERHFGDWTVTSSNMTGTKPDSETLQFVVPLKAGEVKKILYTVVTKW